MEPVTVPFTRGGMPFEGQPTQDSCVIRDLTVDERFGLSYKIEVDRIILTTRTRNHLPSIELQITVGIESPSGEILNSFSDAWRFDESHPDFEYFMQAYGGGFMKNAINGYVKHYLPKNPRFQEVVSNFAQVFSDTGEYLPENND